MSRIYDFTYTGGDSGVPYQVQQYDRLDRAVSQAQYYFDSVRDWRHDVVNYATQTRQDRDRIKTLGDTIASTGQQVEEQFDAAVTAADTAVNARDTAKDHETAAQIARTGAETAETNTKTYATDAAASASSAADILTATEALGITVDTSVGTRVYVGDTMIHGDTGWRDIRDQMQNGWTAGIFNIRRIDSTVYIQAGEVSNTDATSEFVLTLPTGFRTGSSNSQTMGIFQYSSLFTNTVLCGVRGGAGGSSFRIELGAETPSIGGQMSFNTPNSWPTSLPGTPA